MKPPTELEGSLSFPRYFFFPDPTSSGDKQKQNHKGIINESVMLIYTWMEYDMRLFMRRSPGVYPHHPDRHHSFLC